MATKIAPQKVRRTNSANTNAPRGNGGKIFALIIFLILAVAGGGIYYVRQQNLAEQEAQERAEANARAEAEERARLARERAEQEEAERLRLEAEAEAARRRALEKQTPEPVVPAKPEPEPIPQAPDETPEPVPVEPSEVKFSAADITFFDTTSRGSDKFDAVLAELFRSGNFQDFSKIFNEAFAQNEGNFFQKGKLNIRKFRRSRNATLGVNLCLLVKKMGAENFSKFLDSHADGIPDDVPATAGTDFLRWLVGNDGAALDTFICSFYENDCKAENFGYALQKFFQLWSMTPPQNREKYANLAIACALLDPATEQVRGDVREASAISVEEVYRYFCEADQKKRLLADISRLAPNELVFVVDARLPRSEFLWAAENLKFSRERWGDAYGSIRYRMDRATAGVNPYKKYTFEEIQQEGGVCRDQAYFAAMTSKCRGIPATYVGGDGSRGPHAWVVIETADDAWTQTGSYGYNTGTFRNPCNFSTSLHESTLLNRTRKNSGELAKPIFGSIALLEFFSENGAHENAKKTADALVATFPQSTAAWRKKIEISANDGEKTNAEEWKKIVAKLTALGKKNPELMTLVSEISERFLSGDTESATWRKISRQTKKTLGNERSDLLLEMIQRQAKPLVDAKNYRGLATVYKKHLKENASRPDVFQHILAQYMDTVPSGEKRAWTTLAKDAESIFKKEILSNSGEYFRVKKEVAVQRTIASAFERAGDEKKSERLRKDADQRLAEATPEL